MNLTSNIRSYSIRMETFLRSEEQGVEAFRVVVWALVGRTPAGEVETFSEAVGPVAAVGFAEQVEGHQVKQLREARTVRERSNPVADPSVDFAQDLLNRPGRVDPVRVACRDLSLGDLSVRVEPLDRQRERSVLAAEVLGSDRLLEPNPRLDAAKRVPERGRDRMLSVGEDLVGEVVAQLARQVPLALAVLDLGLAEHGSDRQRERVVGVADDHPWRAMQRAEERLPRRLILMPKGLKPPHPRDRRPSRRVSLVPPDGRQDVEASTVAWAAVDPEVLAIDCDRVRPPVGELAGAHEPRADIDPVRDQLPLVRRRPTTPFWIARGDTTRLAPSDLCRRPIARPLRDRHQRLANLTRRKPVLPSACLTLPRLKPRRARHTKRIRLPLPCQNRREPVLRIPVRRSTPPPLATMPLHPIPPIPNDLRARMLRDRTLRNLHGPATLSLQPDISTQIE